MPYQEFIAKNQERSYIVWMDKRNTDINGMNNWDIFLAGSAFESCPANLLLDNEIGTGLYQAGIQINANSQLLPGSDVQFKAGQQVILNPDFAIISGVCLRLSLVLVIEEIAGSLKQSGTESVQRSDQSVFIT